ncbi:Rne/Rng family ribonuclease [Terrihabitans sp. B22-R8]|uniref:Rne/Rng family ribonuclease n=1 Tax=Terrihabitans sp. B22-R8 TaxID=3425128 RepID=UPI00403CAB29
MANKMLIDAAHPEETRVVVVRGSRIEEFDFESANRKQLRGNIYLAKVIRVEPSLQAAFVEYGGNRHGFLAFSEIHPDYYQIPLADRQALLDEEERDVTSETSENSPSEERRSRRGRGRDRSRAKDAQADETVSEEIPQENASSEAGSSDDDAQNTPVDAEARTDVSEQKNEADAGEPTSLENAVAEEAAPEGAAVSSLSDNNQDSSSGEIIDVDDEAPEEIESLGGDDEALEEVPERHQQRRARQYKIQEVIKRRQVLLVQAVKEERGNKGAALTTYLSLAGRYSVLMPNTARGGGISRKVTNAADRKKMKEIASDLEVPEGMGVILRTAGANRTKPEIKRDFEYLLRLWETVREQTLQSTAPALVHEEGSLVKRAIRDLYNRDIDDVQVAGETAFREAKDFMRMLMPSHAKNVKLYRDVVPIFTKHGVEAQLDAMFSSTVTLKSGGYLVMNQTEALVAIDVNSGRSTREQNIEDTALRTNLEAAEEVARQLRLRDLAGLIVVDFIDMEENRNNRAVEKKLKDCLKNDRARIQVGRISHFGLLEMSRQRIRTGVLESSSEVCSVCGGAGRVRSIPSVALHVLRMIEDSLLRNNGYNLVVRTPSAVALYIFNQKRAHLRDIETRFGIEVEFAADDHLAIHEHCVIQRGEPAANPRPVQLSAPDIVDVEEDDAIENGEDAVVEDVENSSAEPATGDESDDEGGENGRRKRRRRRRRGRGERDSQTDENTSDDQNSVADAPAAGEASDRAASTGAVEILIDEATSESSAAASIASEGEETDEAPKSRRRGRRGGRRGRSAAADENTADRTDDKQSGASDIPDSVRQGEVTETSSSAVEPEPSSAEEPGLEPEVISQAVASDAPVERESAAAAPIQEAPKRAIPESTAADPAQPRRTGWWNRLRG